MARILMHISEYVLLQAWQITIVFLLVAFACRLLRSASAHWRYLLWLVVLAKCLVPPLLTVPVGVLPAETTGSGVWGRWFLVNEGSPAGPASGTAAPETAAAGTGQGGSRDAQAGNGLKVPAQGGDRPQAAHLADPQLPGSVRLAAGDRDSTERAALSDPVAIKKWFAIAWATGAVLMLMLAAIRAARIHRQVRRCRRPAAGGLVEQAATLARQLGMARAPAVWLIDGIAQPFVWGVLRGSIYLPGSFAGAGTGDHRRSILMHELAHVARCDAAVNLLQVLVQAAFFFHPLVWWANKRIRQEREKCCDEVAIAHLDAPPRQYGEAIVSSLIHEYESTRPMSSLAVAGPVRNIEERIKTIMNPRKRFHRGPSWLAVSSVLLLAALAAPSAFVLTARAQGQKAASPASAPASQASDASAFMAAVMRLEAYPTVSADELADLMAADLMSDKWKSQDGEFASLTLRNPAPEREARIQYHQEIPVTTSQKKLLFDSPMAYMNIAGHDEEKIVVDAAVFVRSATSSEAARAYAEKIEVEVAPSDEYVRLGEHVLKLKPKDIEVAGVLYTVKIPRRFAVDARMRNGRLSIAGTSGDFVYSGGGMLIVRRLTGAITIDKSGGMTLLADLLGPQPVQINMSRGTLAMVNMAAPVRSNLRGPVYLDLRKSVPAWTDLKMVDAGWINVVLGPATEADLAFTCDSGIQVHQPDGSVVRTQALTQKIGSGGPSLKLNMTLGKMNVWAGTSLPLPPQSRGDGKSADSTAQRG